MSATYPPAAVVAPLVAREPSARSRGGCRLVERDAGTLDGWRIAPDVAERWIEAGIDADYLARLAAAARLDARHLYEFVGIDRTTASRRKAAGAPLPHDAAVKALLAAELLAQADDVFGGPEPAARWLTTPHPVLAGATPLARARTPWGLAKVQGMLAALRHGGVV